MIIRGIVSGVTVVAKYRWINERIRGSLLCAKRSTRNTTLINSRLSEKSCGNDRSRFRLSLEKGRRRIGIVTQASLDHGWSFPRRHLCPLTADNYIPSRLILLLLSINPAVSSLVTSIARSKWLLRNKYLAKIILINPEKRRMHLRN